MRLQKIRPSTNIYNWYLNQGSTAISTSNTLPIAANSVTPNKGGTYTVRLDSTNSGGYIVSNQQYDSYWSFGYLPAFTNQPPASTNLNPGSSVNLSVGVRGSLNVTYAPVAYTTNAGVPCAFWYKGSSLVASQALVLGPTSGTTYSNSAATTTLILNSLAGGDSGNYTVVITNFWGSITSSPTALTVGSPSSPPGFTVQPSAALALLAGQSSAISVTVTGTPPLIYQWRKAGTNLANGGVYGGVFTNVLTLTGVTTNNTGAYTLAVTNSSGAATSSVAAVTIALPPQVGTVSASPGTVQFSGNTVTGLTYVVQSATNLSSPAWLPVFTNNTGVSGTINFNTNTTSGSEKYYRIMFP